jgi:hypothetical protein
MYSKSKAIATSVMCVFVAACGSMVPWRDEPIGDEVNVAFTLQNNLLFLTTAHIDHRSGRFFFGSANARTALDPKFAAEVPSPGLRPPSPAAAGEGSHGFDIGQKESIRFRPVLIDLRGTGDAIIGADVWGRRAITIDYRAGLVTFQKQGIHPDGMALFRYDAEPSITITVDGHAIPAIVDTASPDSLVLPRATPGRGSASVSIGDANLGTIDVGYANIPRAHIGNRLLSKFLVTIDYGRRLIGLWRDPRIPLT